MLVRTAACFMGHVSPRFVVRSSAPGTFTIGNKKITTLSSGLRVLTYADSRALSAVGVFVNMGVRSEDESTVGCSAVYDKCFFHANQKMNAEILAEDLSFMGNSLAVNNHRECVSYIVQCPSYYTSQAIDLLSGALLFPSCEHRTTLASLKEALEEHIPIRSRDPTESCFEALHQTAFGKKTLGRNTHYEKEDLKKINEETISNFIQRCIRPEKVVVVATGVEDHESFVKCVRQCMNFPVKDPTNPRIEEKTEYTGGVVMIHNTQPPESVDKFEEKNHTHIALFFPAPTFSHIDYPIVAVAQCLLGGGQSFSSGGPGKGMLTKLYREVISREGWISSVECITAAYTDAGLLGLYGSASHEYNRHLLRVLIDQAATIGLRISDYHVNMAQQLLLSQMFLVNDTTMGQIEELGRSLLLFDRVLTFEETVAQVQAVTLSDIQRVWKTMINEIPSLAVFGNTSGLEKDVNQIQSRILRSMNRKNGPLSRS